MLISDKCSGSGNSSTMLTSIASTISRFSIIMIMIKIMIIVIMMMIIVVIMMMMMKYLNVDLLEPQAESWEKSSQIDHCHDFRTPPFSFFRRDFFFLLLWHNFLTTILIQSLLKVTKLKKTVKVGFQVIIISTTSLTYTWAILLAAHPLAKTI